jgi:hypothetical protein
MDRPDNWQVEQPSMLDMRLARRMSQQPTTVGTQEDKEYGRQEDAGDSDAAGCFVTLILSLLIWAAVGLAYWLVFGR